MKKIILAICFLFFTTVAFAQCSNIQFQRTFGGSSYEYLKEIENTKDGGFISTGYTESSDGDITINHGNGDCWIIKSNSNGITEWTKTYGGTQFDLGYSIKPTTDGGYIIAGYTESSDGDVVSNFGGGDCWIIKIDSLGTVEWQKTYGGSLRDYASSIIQTTDGGYVVAGYTDSFDGDVSTNFGQSDCWILKINNTGLIEWEKSFGGTSFDYGQEIKQTSDGGYIIVGSTHSNDGNVTVQYGNGDCWLLKLNNLGNFEWQKSFGGSEYEIGNSIELTTDNGYIISGYTQSNDGNITGYKGNGDVWVIKCDPFGNLQWQKSLGSTGNDYAYCIQKISACGYILTGYSELNDADVTCNHGNYDCWVIKLDNTGEILIQNSYGGTLMDIGHSIRQTENGSFIVAGLSQSNDGDVIKNQGNADAWIIKLNETSLSLEAENLFQTVNVFPNPSNGDFNFIGLNDDSSIEIYDTAGKFLFKSQIKTNNYKLDLTKEKDGIYFYIIVSKSGEITKGKIIKN